MLILIAILICFILWLVIVSQRFRLVFFLLTVFVAIGGGIWYLQQASNVSSSQLLQQAATAFASAPPSYAEYMEIKPDQFTLTNVSFEKPGFGSRFFKISGEISNTSKAQTISSFKIKITVGGCPVSAECIVVGDKTVQVWIEVPPGQTRKFVQELDKLAGVSTNDNLTWNWAITATYVKEPGYAWKPPSERKRSSQ